MLEAASPMEGKILAKHLGGLGKEQKKDLMPTE
jgi:hypothetical protein